MNKDFLAVAESHYKAIIDKEALTMNIYMNSAVGGGEHPQIFDEFVESFEKYSNAVSSFELIQKLKSQYDNQDNQDQPETKDES